MKQLVFSILYWLAAIIVLSLILLSTSYSFGEAFLISSSILPGALMTKYFSKSISYKNRRKGIYDTIYLVSAVLVTIYLNIILVHWYLLKVNPENIMMNPVFLFMIVSLFTGINLFLERKLFSLKRPVEEKYIEFVSERKKIKIELDTIIYIESNNNEVWIMTTTGEKYRTKMKISRWEEILDERFVRIHRSYIVNKNHIRSYSANSVSIGEIELDISRKYKTLLSEE